jgi:Putative prokaryotic signal transducing protein
MAGMESMYCPECKSEYREGFTHCSDCDVDLVSDLPAGELSVELVNVFETSNPALVPLAEFLLNEAGIDFLKKNENLQDMFGGGRVGAGFNFRAGPVQFWVRADDVAAAQALLAGIEASVPEMPEE